MSHDSIVALAEALGAGERRRVIAVTGAGISTGAGIADFRSAGGLFETVQALYGEQFPRLRAEPEFFFTRRFRDAGHADLQDERTAELAAAAARVRPTAAHYLLALLHRKGLLARVYTQNIDGLHQAAGLPPELVVEVHGSLDAVVFYDDPLPPGFFEAMGRDFPKNGDD